MCFWVWQRLEKVLRFRKKIRKYSENFFCIKSLATTCDDIVNAPDTASINSNDEKVSHKTNFLVS